MFCEVGATWMQRSGNHLEFLHKHAQSLGWDQLSLWTSWSTCCLSFCLGLAYHVTVSWWSASPWVLHWTRWKLIGLFAFFCFYTHLQKYREYYLHTLKWLCQILRFKVRELRNPLSTIRESKNFIAIFKFYTPQSAFCPLFFPHENCIHSIQRVFKTISNHYTNSSQSSRIPLSKSELSLIEVPQAWFSMSLFHVPFLSIKGLWNKGQNLCPSYSLYKEEAEIL